MVAADCVVSRAVIQLFACDLVTCFGKVQKNYECVIRPEVTLFG